MAKAYWITTYRSIGKPDASAQINLLCGIARSWKLRRPIPKRRLTRRWSPAAWLARCRLRRRCRLAIFRLPKTDG